VLIPVGYGSVEASSITIPAGHQVGDLIVIFAYRDGSATPPTLPAGWTSGASHGANTNSCVLGWKIAASSAEVSGTWTNATDMVVHVYRGVHATTPLGTPQSGSGTGTTVTYSAVTLKSKNSWLAAFAGHRSTNTTLEAPPAGMTNRTNTAGATAEVSGHDTGGQASSWPSTNVSVGGTSSGWESMTVEIIPAVMSFGIHQAPIANDTNAGVISIFAEKIR